MYEVGVYMWAPHCGSELEYGVGVLVSVSDPDTPGSALNWPPGSGSSCLPINYENQNFLLTRFLSFQFS
jgi:hypothetical protein